MDLAIGVVLRCHRRYLAPSDRRLLCLPCHRSHSSFQAPILIAAFSSFCLVVATGLVVAQVIIMMLGRIGDTPLATSGRGRTYSIMCNLGLYLSVPMWGLALMFYLSTRIAHDDNDAD